MTKQFYYSLLSLAFLVLLSAGQDAWAQVTGASVIGKITDEQGAGLPGVTVLVRNESTGFQAATLSNSEGSYSFKQLPLGKPYEVRATYIGHATQVQNNFALNLGDQLIVDFVMRQAATDLEEVVVTTNSLSSRIERAGASTFIRAQDIEKLPTMNRDFTNLASLAPTVNGGNISGQRASSTNYLIDGVSARNNLTSGDLARGPYGLSMEAIREFEVVTNVYDVTYGRQGGGAISAVTKSGTNSFTGSVFDYYRSDFLSSPYDIRGNKREQNFTTNQYGFSLGGPIIKDKLHFFTALDRQNETMPFFIADIREAADENALRISRGALDTLITIGREKYGLSNNPQVGEFERKTLANTFFARLDWQINERNQLTLRNNYSDWNNPYSISDNSPINLFEVYGDFKSRENSTLLSLRTQFRPTLLNELKVQYQRATRNYVPNKELPSSNIPRAIVTVRSQLPNGTLGNTQVQLGGQRYLPEDNLEDQVQLVNTTYLTRGRYNFTFGTDNTLTYLDTYISSEQNGRFIFNSLEDFANLNPSRYAREVPLQGVPSVQQWVLNGSLFGQVQYEPLPNVEATLGLRWDVTSYLDAGEYNPVVDEALGLRTDNNPTDWNNIQPRLQLTWDVAGRRTDVLKFGAGMFSANPITYAQVNNIQNSGTMVAAVDVTRPASGVNLVPRPDFPAYRQDPSTVPGLIPGAPTVSTINLNDADLQMPSVFKANLNYNKIIGDWLRLGVNLLYSKTWNNYVYLDRNLVEEPYFLLANEDNRGVFVPAGTITQKGITDNVLGRKTQAVGRTLEFTNGAELRQAAVIVDADIRYLRDGYLNLSYTWNDSRDNTSYNGNVANTSTFRPVKSDPRDLSEMYYSDNHFRHKVVVFGSTPSLKGFVLSGAFTGLGGTRYSLLVDADINGDFVGGPGTDNDLAFAFDPSDPNTPESVKVSMEKVLANPDNRAVDYIRESLGGIADRNGGSNPFSGTFDVRLAKTFKTFKDQGLTMSVDVFNFANLLNKDWGVNYNLRNQNLLFVTGFDQEKQQYSYRVNENVGVTQQNGTPYQIQVGAKYSF